MKSKKSKYFFLICTVIFILTCSIIYYSYNNYKNENLLKTEKGLIKNSQKYSVFILNTINPVTTLIENTGALLACTDLKDSSEIKMIFNKMTDNVPIISNVYFVNHEDGDMFNCNGKVNNGINLRNRIWYKKASSSEKPIITQVYNDLHNEKPVITIAYGIKKDNKLKGVFSADIFLEDIYKTFEITTYTENTVHYITDDCGNIILHPLEKLLGFSMWHAQKSYMDQFPNQQKKTLKIYTKIWKENKMDILNYTSEIFTMTK